MFNGTSGERCNTVVSSSVVLQGASGYTFGGNLVKDGSRGEFCKAWQKFFNDKAGAHLSVDGNCGPLTMTVAKTWQGTHGLVVDGILGALSRAKANLQ
jgi:peptidoglycan hydrolase-like protein with peptidoglycan-binding domain